MIQELVLTTVTTGITKGFFPLIPFALKALGLGAKKHGIKKAISDRIKDEIEDEIKDRFKKKKKKKRRY